MGVVRDKLDYLSGTKRLLRDAINAILADRGDPLLTESDPFEDYPSALWALSPAPSVGSLTGSAADKLLRLNETKHRMREAINAELGIGLTEDDAFRVYSGRIWNPRALFLNGEQGAWYDPSDLTTIYQDAAGATPVAADGDPVGLMLDKSGNGNHASQSNSLSRPIYRTDGALHWLEFDGVDDFLSVQYASLLQQPAILSVAGAFLSGGGKVLVTGFTTTNRHQISSNTGTNLIVFAGTSLLTGSNAPLAKSIISGVFNGSNSEARVNGVGAIGDAGTLSSDGLTIGALPGVGNAAQARLYGLIHVENDGNSISQVETYLATKSGVQL